MRPVYLLRRPHAPQLPDRAPPPCATAGSGIAPTRRGRICRLPDAPQPDPRPPPRFVAGSGEDEEQRESALPSSRGDAESSSFLPRAPVLVLLHAGRPPVLVVLIHASASSPNHGGRISSSSRRRRQGLSWTFEKHGIKLEWRWKLQSAPNTQQTISGILDFLMDANIRLSEEVVRKTQSFDKLKQEAEKCLEQSERLNKEKADFEEATFTKFVAVINSKKAKLRQLRDKIAERESVDKPPKEEEERDNSTDRTELFEEGSDKEASVNNEPSETGSGDHHSSPEKSGATSRGTRGSKRTRK